MGNEEQPEVKIEPTKISMELARWRFFKAWLLKREPDYGDFYLTDFQEEMIAKLMARAEDINRKFKRW